MIPKLFTACFSVFMEVFSHFKNNDITAIMK